MDQLLKKEIFQEADHHVHHTASNIELYQKQLETSIRRTREDLVKQRDDCEYLIEVLVHQLERQKHLASSYKSPYFVRCDVEFDDEKETRTLYFGRFPLIENSVYSWIAPAASIRFESPGTFSYILPDGNKRTGKLLRKDQFLIIDRKIFFMSSEDVSYLRELIYQEYFSQKKTGFILPEIVEQMEKAQDTIIRSHYRGSFLISGVAGSGKTTLALHRVAYLAQSPETAKLFQPGNITVFVQDASTKKYFSDLLPSLGIYSVNITTFDEWAMKLLEITDMQYVRRYGKTEVAKDTYEYRKNIALQSMTDTVSEKQLERILMRVYRNYLSDDQLNLLNRQLQEKVLDRFDLTVLLKIKLSTEKSLIEKVEMYKKLSNNKYGKKVVKQAVNYSLIIIDEAENYLKEQIQIIKTCVDRSTNAVIYVGDLVQRTWPWTIRDWSQVHEEFREDRRIILQKVYRNTRQILEYIQSIGFSIDIPSKLKEGKEIVEKVFLNKQEEIQYVKELVAERKNDTVGILAKTSEYLEDYMQEIVSNGSVFIMTINEAQGVEFDKVILVGIDKHLYESKNDVEEINSENKKVNRDLLYVALTRAMSELYVLGTSTIKDLFMHE